MNTTAPRLSAYDLRRVAVAADVDPRTVGRVLSGGRVQRANRAAVLAAMARLGIAVPSAAAPTTGEAA